MSVPIPPPSAYSCPKCGQELAQQLPSYCPRCGARLEAAPRFSGCLIVLLVLMAIPASLAGSCFLLFSTSGGEFSGDRLILTLIGLACLGFAALCIWGIVALSRRRRGK